MDIQESLHHILEQKESVADLFYVVFLERYPEVRRHFDQVNLKHQAVLLTMALMVMAQHYSHAYPATEMYLKYLGTRHQARDIPPDSYPKFRDALLATLAQFHGKDWDGRLEGQWCAAIDRASQTMFAGYREHFHV